MSGDAAQRPSTKTRHRPAKPEQRRKRARSLKSSNAPERETPETHTRRASVLQGVPHTQATMPRGDKKKGDRDVDKASTKSGACRSRPSCAPTRTRRAASSRLAVAVSEGCWLRRTNLRKKLDADKSELVNRPAMGLNLAATALEAGIKATSRRAWTARSAAASTGAATGVFGQTQRAQGMARAAPGSLKPQP